MRCFNLLVILSVVLCTSSASAYAGQLLYVASPKEKAVLAYEVHADSGELELRFRHDLQAAPGPMAFSPDMQKGK